MSHKATNWAFEQPELFPDMKPNEWAVLLVLADCHNPVKGCFPSQDYLSRKTNLGERSVRDQLNQLRERGLINWDASREDGRRAINRYSLAFEEGFLPANLAGSSTGKNEQELPANSDSFYRQNLPPNLVIEPVIEPERERGREALEGFDSALKAWPSGFADNRAEALEAWMALTVDERAEAVGEITRFVNSTRAVGRTRFCSFAGYLGERRWKALPDRPAPVERPAARHRQRQRHEHRSRPSSADGRRSTPPNGSFPRSLTSRVIRAPRSFQWNGRPVTVDAVDQRKQ